MGETSGYILFRLGIIIVLGFIEDIRKFFAENVSLIEEEEAILFHNDYQSQNIIVSEEPTGYKITGLIDFDKKIEIYQFYGF